MTKSERNPKLELLIQCRRRREESFVGEELDQRLLTSSPTEVRASSFGLLSSFVIRHSSFCISFVIWISSFLSSVAADSSATVVTVVGAPGEAEYGSNFLHQAELWKSACSEANVRQVVIGLEKESATNDYELLKQALAAEPKDGAEELWLVLIGHGTFDGKEARFNLRGPDFSATELAAWLKPFHRPLAVIDESSSSAPFINKLSGTNRVIITATRGGYEQNYARFGEYFAKAITAPEADLDKDGQVSLLEAFLMASRQATEFYKISGRLATEHALLDDNGDGLGTPADWFRGLRAVKKPKENAPVDGLLAQQFVLIRNQVENNFSPEQRVQRDAMERAVFLHREKKGQMPEEEYYRELEKLLLELARFYEGAGTNGPPGT